MENDHQWEIDLGKIILLGLCLVGVTALALHDDLSSDSAIAFYTFFVGYIVGNGINATRKVPTKGILNPVKKEETDDV